MISRRRPDGRRRLPSHAKPRLVGRSVARSGGKWGPAAEDAATAATVTFAIDGISDEERERETKRGKVEMRAATGRVNDLAQSSRGRARRGGRL